MQQLLDEITACKGITAAPMEGEHVLPLVAALRIWQAEVDE